MPVAKQSKIILITGSSSGFGLLTAVRLAAKGHIVYATMRDLAKQNDLLEAVGKEGGAVLVRVLDVTQPHTIKAVMDEIKHKHNRLDVVVNNAGYGLGGFFEDLGDDEIREQMDVNFFGVQNVCRAVIPLMRQERSGHIINVSSIAGQTGTPALGAYNASKWALEGFSESLYQELREFGIRIVLVEPGSYPTKIFKDNARYCRNYHNPNSIYFAYGQTLKAFVQKHTQHSKRNPEVIAHLIAKIINTPDPKLRYVSDFSSWLRVATGKMLPPSLYHAIYRKALYEQSQRSL